MVLVCVAGELGIGKTLTLTYLGWNNWYFKKRILATNYTLYGLPFIRIKTVKEFFKFIPEETSEEEILKGQQKWLGGDDFWRWVSSQTFGLRAKEKNDIIGRILMASRKANVTVTYSTQLWSMITKNVREITDLLMKPILSPDLQYCKVYVYGVVEGKVLQPMQPYYFMTEPIYALYNTYERAGTIIMNDLDEEGEVELKEATIPINTNPAFKKYCRDNLNLDINSEEFLKKCEEMQIGITTSREENQT